MYFWKEKKLCQRFVIDALMNKLEIPNGPRVTQKPSTNMLFQILWIRAPAEIAWALAEDARSLVQLEDVQPSSKYHNKHRHMN